MRPLSLNSVFAAALTRASMTHSSQDSGSDDTTQCVGPRRVAHLTRDEALARDLHRMAILRHLVAHPGQSRQALTEALALPRSTAAHLISHLLDEGWLQERASIAIGRRGRPAAPLHVQPQRLLKLVAEMDEGVVRVVATSLSGELLGSEHARHDAGPNASEALEVVARMLLRMQARVYSPDRRVLGVSLEVARGMDAPDDDEYDALLLRLLGQRLRGTPLQRTSLRLHR